MADLMNYSMGEIPPADLLRLFLKHGITRIPTAAVWEMYEIIKPHLSFLERTAVSALITGFYNPNLAELLKAVEKRPSMRSLPKSLMYDYRITSILRRHIDPEKWVPFQLGVFEFGENVPRPGGASAPETANKNRQNYKTMSSSVPIFRNTVAAGTTALTSVGTASRNRNSTRGFAALNANLLAMAPSPLPTNVLGPPRTPRTGPRRTVRNRSAVATAAANNSNENSNTNNVPSYTGPRRVYPELTPVAVPAVPRRPLGLAVQGSERLFPSGPSRSKRSIGYKNTPAPPTLNMPRPRPTGERSLLTGRYRATRKGLKRRAH